MILKNSVKITKNLSDAYLGILTTESVDFIESLYKTFQKKRNELLEKRKLRQKEIDSGVFPDFLEETKEIRESEWKVAQIPDDLLDRRVEITGPVDRKMVINALNSGANVFMADFEDSNSPTWENNLDGQINLRDAVRKNITFRAPEGKEYKLNTKTATLMVRPRGWHLEERHFFVNDEPISASLFDFGLYFFHNAKALIKSGSAPYFYLPKLENHLEARLWNDIFVFSQKLLGIPNGTIRATVLIENILAGFEMDEILYELRDHSAGENCGRWDYIFSVIRKFRNIDGFLMPDRAQITMDKDFLNSYVQLLIQTCHNRGIHAMGGMAAQIPIKNDPSSNEAALEKVKKDKLREVMAGHDGTWVAHPALVPVAKEIFDKHMKSPNQIGNIPYKGKVTASDLLKITKGEITEAGLRTNISVGILYIEPWLRGTGCVPINNLMEDAATAEISRSQIWQWFRHNAVLSNGIKVSKELIVKIIREELDKIQNTMGYEKYNTGKFELAGKLFEEISTGRDFTEFLTIKAYDYIV